MLRRIGGGSYGDVWLAQSTTGQLRAVKVVWRKNFSSERPYDREFSGIVQIEPFLVRIRESSASCTWGVTTQRAVSFT